MKKICHLFLVVLISTLLIFTFTGCKKNSTNDGDAGESSEFVFVPEFTSLSAFAGDLPNIDNIILTESAVYFTSTSDIESATLFRTTQIYRADLTPSNSTNLSNYVRLPNYLIPNPPPNAEGGGVYITAMHTDSNGNLWVAETHSYVTFDFPAGFDENDAKADEIWEFRKPLETFHTVRQLDNTGVELLSVNIDPLLSEIQSWGGITALYVDDNKNIYIAPGQTIFVISTNGNVQFSLSTDDFIHPKSFIRLSDGRVAHAKWNNRLMRYTMQVIDIQNKSWGATTEFPINTQGVFNGHEEYLVVFNDGSDLLALDNDTNEIVHILNWVAGGIGSIGLDNILFLPDDRIVFTTTSWGQDDNGQPSRHTELVVFTKTPQDEIREKTILKLVTVWPHLINNAVVEFNRANSLYRIELIELDINWQEPMGDFDKMALEIITGKGPDIIHTTMFPVNQWAGRGFLTDIYEFIDADPVFNRSDFMESVLRALEMNGKLYQMASDFSISTLIGHPNVVGRNPGWSIDELGAVLEANPQATKPFGDFFDGSALVYSIYRVDNASFVDWESGTVNFDNDYFVSLLEFARNIVVTGWDEIDFGAGGYMSQPYRDISSGEQIIMEVSFSRPWMYSAYQDLFNGDFVFKGFPVETGSGNSLSINLGFAITSASKNQQGAWEFIRFLISEEWQNRQLRNDDGVFSLPTNKNVFELSIANAMVENRGISVSINDFNTVSRPLTQEHVNIIRALVDSTSGVSFSVDPLFDIFTEGMANFFNGVSTAQDTARIIQNRASRYVSEQR